MNLYRVPVTFTFDGYFEVKAETAEEAKTIADNDCGLVLGGNIHASNDAVSTWGFKTHPEKTVGKIHRLRQLPDNNK